MPPCSIHDSRNRCCVASEGAISKLIPIETRQKEDVLKMLDKHMKGERVIQKKCHIEQ